MDFVHEVVNQSAPLVGHDLFAGDAALQDALRLNAPGLDVTGLARLGPALASADMQAHARRAHQWVPQLRTHDRWGRRADEVEFHPSYHALMTTACEAGLHGSPWQEGEGAHLLRAAGFLMFTQLEPATLCPVSMTYAALPALAGHAALQAAWGPGLSARAYDARPLPWHAKAALTLGMGMTEKQGGSDLRSNTTRAEHDGEDAWGRRMRVTGHKWFFSAPMCDAHLVLAQAPSGLSCLLLPRILPDGTRNGVHIQRLKDKLGNRANASAEVEFDRAAAWLVGEEGRGVPQILAMGALTRLDCALGSSGLMRAAVSLAIDHARQRSAFGRPLINQPLMRNVLADLALEAEAACALSLRLARAVDRSADPREAALARVLTPVAKFWICKRGSAFAQEAMECLGGNGYVEDAGEGVLARIYREMPVNSIWEGAGNIMALDLLRALRRPEARDALEAELALARGADAALDRYAAGLLERCDTAGDEQTARSLVHEVAVAVQASLLWRGAPAFVAQAFCDARLGPRPGPVFGMLAAHLDVEALVQRALPR
jgi:putative acyl-CoA dehydrogenase